MLFRTPKFWYSKNNGCVIKHVIGNALSPLSCLYQYGHKHKLSHTKTGKANIDVICVGNITMGGSGKTPVCIALHKLINEAKIYNNPYFLTRGYAGNETKSRRIEVHDTVQAVGDEPLLLASHSKTIISRNRYAGANMAHELGADCVIMDDGFQNASLHKDISFIVIDGSMGLGNGKTFPCGPLREPLDFALERADAVIIIGKDLDNIEHKIKAIPVFHASIEPCTDTLDNIDKNASYIAFAGIGIPDKFFDTLDKNSIKVIEKINYPDHYQYKRHDIENLANIAKNKGARLITTEKDYIRLPNDLQKDVYMFPIQLLWNDQSLIEAFIRKNGKQTDT